MRHVLKNKKLLLLGGRNLGSVDIIKYAKSQGVYTIVTDYLTEEESFAKKYSDENWDISTGDTERLVALIKENNIDGVFAGIHEFNISKVIEICEELQLPCYCTRQQWELLTDKNCVKELWKQFHIGTAKQYEVSELKAANYPLIVKPVDGSGADGISVCDNEVEVFIAIENAKKVSNKHEVVIEEYIEGEECTVFYLLVDGVSYLMGVSNRHVKEYDDINIPLPVAYSMPSKHLQNYLDNIDKNVKQMFQYLNMANGMVFMQAKIKDNNFYFYDIGYRLTGSLEYKLFEEMYGANPLKMLVNYSLTGKMIDTVIEEPDLLKKKSGNITFLIRPGTIGEIIGLEEVLNASDVIDVYCSYREGDNLPTSIIGTLRQVIIRVFFVVDTVEKMKTIMDFVHKTIHVLDINGEEMLLEPLDTEVLYKDVIS